jgi:phosphoribosyl 1,2-cyclic phosphate phosphodiesterase
LKVKVQLLGTGTSQGVPVIACDCAVCRSTDRRDNRLRASLWVEVAGQSWVIDTGPDFRSQMLRLGAKRLDAVLFTHQHKDHTAGLDDIRAFNFRQRKDMPLYGRLEVLNQIKEEFAYIFAAVKYPGIPQVELHAIENKPFEIAGVKVMPIEVMHHNLPVFGFRIGDFTYITDANRISPHELEKVRGTKVLILNALKQEKHISHFSLEEALAVIAELKPERAYITHISHQMGLHAEVEKTLPPQVFLAYDGLSFEV